LRRRVGLLRSTRLFAVLYSTATHSNCINLARTSFSFARGPPAAGSWPSGRSSRTKRRHDQCSMTPRPVGNPVCFLTELCRSLPSLIHEVPHSCHIYYSGSLRALSRLSRQITWIIECNWPNRSTPKDHGFSRTTEKFGIS
jgi:hypothetical protein